MPDDRRLLSLDAFRGMTIAAMIVVDCPGGLRSFPALQHAQWHGLTPTDLIFPSFLFIMGVSLALSLTRRRQAGASERALLAGAARRGAILFGLGLIYNGFPFLDLAHIRVMNVLQRIALCSFFGSWLFLKTSAKAQASASAALLIGYWLLMTRVPVPGLGAGNLTPEGNWASYLDRLVLGGHLYRPLYDPEGLLSTLPSLATTLCGILTGRWLLAPKAAPQKTKMMLLAGVACLAAGSLWALDFPINKALWTSSFCLVTAGIALAAFTAFYWLIEVKGLRSWAGLLRIFGMNAITVYLLSAFFYEIQKRVSVGLADGQRQQLRYWLCDRLFGFWMPERAASLSYAALYCLLCLAAATALYRRNIFIKV